MIEQGTPEWFAVKAGKASASNASKITAGGKGITRSKYLYKLALERITGHYIHGYKGADMDRGNEMEAQVRQAYEERMFTPVKESPFIDHPHIPNAGASPDGLVGKDGLIEIKTREYHIQLEFVRTKKIGDAALKQMYFQLACCPERKWCDYVSYMAGDEEMLKNMPEYLLMQIVRVERDDVKIKQLEAAFRQADAEVEALVDELRRINDV